MSAELEIMGVTTITDEGWAQPKEDAVDVSQYTEAAIIATVYALDRNGANTTIVELITAVDNSEERYVVLNGVASLSADPASYPATYMVYQAGPGVGDEACGFARFLRVQVVQAAGASITLDVKAILKP